MLVALDRDTLIYKGPTNAKNSEYSHESAVIPLIDQRSTILRRGRLGWTPTRTTNTQTSQHTQLAYTLHTHYEHAICFPTTQTEQIILSASIPLLVSTLQEMRNLLKNTINWTHAAGCLPGKEMNVTNHCITHKK